VTLYANLITSDGREETKHVSIRAFLVSFAVSVLRELKTPNL